MNKQTITEELTDSILPFWIKLKDEQYGGLYGTVAFDLAINREGDKGGIATARHLWAFSSAYRVLGNPVYLTMATHLFRFLKEQCIDKAHHGLYWMLDYKGVCVDDRKHIYAQAFAIYGLSEYYRVTKDEEAIQLALDLYDLIETNGFDEKNQAYKEAFNRTWEEVPNEMLSENGVTADITMNTHIHILEAYTNLYKAYPFAELRARLLHVLSLHLTKMYQEDHFLGVFFNKDWERLLDLQSFGHDIEASWLIDEALKVLDIEADEYHAMVIAIAENILGVAVEADGSLVNERENGRIDRTRIWWVQAEAVVGFYNAYEKTGNVAFKEAAEAAWSYIIHTVKDKRERGEWYWAIDPDGVPVERDLVEPWKVSYHNTRCCLELIERMS